MNRTASRIADPINDDDDDEGVGSKRGSQRQSQHNVGDIKSLSLNKTTENFKTEIPTSCHVSMMKKVLIEKQMPFKYVLASHPYPKHEGEMIIFKPKREDQEKGAIVVRDYSLRKRIETVPKVKVVED